MEWLLYKNPGLIGRVTCEQLELIRMDALDRAACSETLLPVAKAVKNRAFTRRFLELANCVRNCGCSSMDNTILGFQSGRMRWSRGFWRNWALAKREFVVLGINVKATEKGEVKSVAIR